MSVDFPFLVLLATFVFFAGQTWEHLGNCPRWASIATGIGAAVLALSALLTLIK